MRSRRFDPAALLRGQRRGEERLEREGVRAERRVALRRDAIAHLELECRQRAEALDVADLGELRRE